MKSQIDFVRYCINNRQCLPSITDWNALFAFMKEQALLGIGFIGLEKLNNSGIKVPREVLLKWFAISEQIRHRNIELNKRCVELTKKLKEDGFKCCILKGQGNAKMYPDPSVRTCGDIDAWVEGGRKKVLTYIRKTFSNTILRYHHVEYPIFRDVMVEIHFFPFFMNNPLYNKRLQEWL